MKNSAGSYIPNPKIVHSRKLIFPLLPCNREALRCIFLLAPWHTHIPYLQKYELLGKYLLKMKVHTNATSPNTKNPGNFENNHFTKHPYQSFSQLPTKNFPEAHVNTANHRIPSKIRPSEIASSRNSLAPLTSFSRRVASARDPDDTGAIALIGSSRRLLSPSDRSIEDRRAILRSLIFP